MKMQETENDTKQNKKIEKNSDDFYKETVFLPKTDFPMRGSLPKKEPEILKKWDEINLYTKMQEQNEDKPAWILHDGPPYANGNIHMGHAMNKILKDVVVKSYQMTGYRTPYVPGWDCHGLPIEWKIEEKYRKAGKDKDEVDHLVFRDECRKFAREWVDVQSKQFQRLGVTGDWKNPYLTLTNKSEAGIVREIHKFAANGGLYKGAKPVMWSCVEKTALAEAEVEYKEHKSVTVWVRFPIITASNPLLEGADIVIWTTTPWTLPSNRAVAYGADIEYGVYEVKCVAENDGKPGHGPTAKPGDRLVLSVSLSESVMKSAKIEEWELLGTLFGREMQDGGEDSRVPLTVCKHPLNGFLKSSSRKSLPERAGEDGRNFGAEGTAKLEWTPAFAGMRGMDSEVTPEEGWEPVYNFDVAVLAADFVTEEAGTGFVHIAPGHGQDDFFLGVANGIEVTDNVADDGKFREHVPLFAGLEVYTQEGKMGPGNFVPLKALDEAGALLAKGSLRHEYPHSWRSGAPVIFRTTPQWFIGMEENNLRKRALNAIKETKWFPAKGQARITAMIEQRPDWCISRQRAWGVPIALFLNKDSGEILKDETVFARIADIFEQEGSDAWWSRPVQDFLGENYNVTDYDQVFDIVDVWFESGSTHAFVCEERQELYSPADLYLEGSDQHRGWFHSSLLESCGTRGRAPYKAVLTHGFVLDEGGYKMSKSQGNVVDPLKVMEQYGADILRLWVMSSDYEEDIRVGKDTMKNSSDLYRRVRNTLRFLLGALDGFSEAEKLETSEYYKMPELERLMLHNLYEMDQKIRTSIENYEFGKLANMLHHFCNNDLSAFYFDIRKDRLYCDRIDLFERRACRTVIAHIFDHLVTWLAPILSFTAEEAWSHCPVGIFKDVQSIHLREFPKVPESWQDEALALKWKAISKVRKDILAAIEPLRASKELGSSLEACPVLITNCNHVKSIGNEMADICITSQIKTNEGEPGVTIEKAQGNKCRRCWKILSEVSEDEGLCSRCSDAASQYDEKAA